MINSPDKESLLDRIPKDFTLIVVVGFLHQPNMYSIALETIFEFFCGVLLPSGTT